MKTTYLLLLLFITTLGQAYTGRNVIGIRINSDSTITVKDEIMPVDNIRAFVKDYVSNPYRLENYPEMKLVDVPLLGKCEVSKAVVSIYAEKNATYGLYFAVNYEVEKAYDELRDALALEQFKKPFKNLSKAQAYAIKKAIPKRISEAEPYNTGYYWLSGCVMNSHDQKPLAYAKVQVYNKDSLLESTTADENGWYWLSIDKTQLQSYTIRVEVDYIDQMNLSEETFLSLRDCRHIDIKLPYNYGIPKKVMKQFHQSEKRNLPTSKS